MQQRRRVGGRPVRENTAEKAGAASLRWPRKLLRDANRAAMMLIENLFLRPEFAAAHAIVTISGVCANKAMDAAEGRVSPAAVVLPKSPDR
jgi:hypothetical protein